MVFIKLLYVLLVGVVVTLKINVSAPNFSLPDSNGKNISLSSLLGKWVVLYFYPKDNTPGCTIEAVDFTHLAKDFSKLNCVVLGVSKDSCSSHSNFSKLFNLGVILLSDPDGKMQTDYGVWGKKQFAGKEYMGTTRTTYLIDPNGKIVFIWENVEPIAHANFVLEKLKELSRKFA
jgi:peroxiredoxin Q/BCP